MYKRENRKAILLLEDGKVFYGRAAGKVGTTFGEICFNTGMTGYQEIFTDPSYYGQILVASSVHIGNYGITQEDTESDSIKIAGFVCKKFSDTYSRPCAEKSLQEYFLENNLVAISDVDTRAVVRYVREKGAMNAAISSENLDIHALMQELKKVPSMAGLELSSKVTTSEIYDVKPSRIQYKIALLDLGVKQNIIRMLVNRGAWVRVFPMHTSYETMMQWNPDGFMISNGPGDPAAMKDTIQLIKKIIDSSLPVFGICLGHQLIALANGLITKKMHHGHRGLNHPVKNLLTGKCEITSQNHGFVVAGEEVSKNPDIEVTHIHLNDNTIAGIRMKTKPVFSVQYHPEASPGPHDSSYLFDQFIEAIEKSKIMIR